MIIIKLRNPKSFIWIKILLILIISTICHSKANSQDSTKLNIKLAKKLNDSEVILLFFFWGPATEDDESIMAREMGNPNLGYSGEGPITPWNYWPQIRNDNKPKVSNTTDTPWHIHLKDVDPA